MTLVRFKMGRPSSTGVTVPAVGKFVVSPTRLRVVEGDPDTTILPAEFPVAVPESGLLELELAATGPGWCWHLKASGFGVSSWQEYVAVPEALPDPDNPGEFLPVDYPDLVRVDPKTLEPTAEPVAAWWAGVDEMKQAALESAVLAAAAAAAATSAVTSATEAEQEAIAASAAAGTIIEMTESGYLSPTALSDTIGESIATQIPPLVADAIASDPTVANAAAAAVAAEIEGLDLLEAPEEPDAGVLVSIRDAGNHRTWLEANATDGGPTAHATTMVGDAIVADRGLLEAPEEPDSGVLVSVRDAGDHRTWLEANSLDGGPTAYATALIVEALEADQPSTTIYVASGDSMTGDAYGGGTTYPAKLAALTDSTVINNGSGGRRASEISIVAGALAFPIAIPGGQIPGNTTTVSVIPTLPDTGPSGDRPFNVTIQGVPCTLVYTQSTTSWTIARKAAGTATAVPKTGAVAIPITTYDSKEYVHLLWGGRNNTPKSTATVPMLAAAAWCKEQGMRFLLVGVCNTSSEGAGTAGLNDVLALNDTLRSAYPREYVEMRGRMISQGLALADVAPTAGDTTAIADDRIPDSLLADGLHFNDAGRTACAAILHDELTQRGI